MDKGLINKFIAWSLITFGTFATMGCLIGLLEGAGMELLVGWLLAGLAPITGGLAVLRNTNRYIKRLKQGKYEREILRLASKSDGRITTHDIVINTPLNLEEARKKLEKMQKYGDIDIEISETGSIVYTFPSLLPNGKKRSEGTI